MYTTDENSISFFWDSDKIFDMASLRIGYAVRGVNKKDKNNELVEMSDMLSLDDMDIFIEFLTEAMLWLYGRFSDITLSGSDSFFIHQPSIELGIFISGIKTEIPKNKTGEIKLCPSQIDTLSSTAQDMIVCYIVRRWAETNKLDTLVSNSSNQRYQSELEFNNVLTKLKLKPYSSCFIN